VIAESGHTIADLKRMNYTIRFAGATDELFLWQMLYYAAHMDEDGEAVESARTNPDLRDYVSGWSERTGDIGVIALAPDGGEVGASWARVMPAQSPLYRFVVQGTPEVAIAVAPDHLGAGAGTLLLRCLLEAASCSHPRLALSVRAGNPAKRLYERLGFVTVGSITNRAGGTSYVMEIVLAYDSKCYP
jgi:ribosomal protein S18 acetylase RimI-like enzyme